MNPTWWIPIALGAACGAVIVGTWLRAMQVPREGDAYMRGVRDARDGVAPRRPVDDPRFRHPTIRDRGASDVMIALSALTVAGVVLLASGTFGGGS